ncbi:unnamed protein product [Schistosoma mattheei]|uniref:Amino acid transporter n=1 Tax=Schistosoma mattheei TaxID=31246 RepID=A0A3P7YFN2_9TREM|nr:unnamed protein product [Schistosoma mattheei]
MIYYVVTTMLAVILGIGLVLCIHPGDTSIKDEIGEGTIEERRPETLDSLLDLLRLKPNADLHHLIIAHHLQKWIDSRLFSQHQTSQISSFYVSFLLKCSTLGFLYMS